MNRTKLVVGLMAVAVASAQTAPLYRITVTARSASAIRSQHRNGATSIGFKGTALLPEARGEAKVEGKKGFIGIEARFHDLPEASHFGAEYLTYVLWAVTTEGRTSNLGEILRDGN